MKSIDEEILPYLGQSLRLIFNKMCRESKDKLEEIRLRAQKPLMVSCNANDWFVTADGRISKNFFEAYEVTQQDVFRVIELMSENSIYAYQDEITSGYLTIKGGHRVGLSGKVVVADNKIKNIKEFNGLNIRIAKEITGCALPVFKYIINGSGDVYNTLVVGPPQCGKTTILRDLTRLLSNGSAELDFKGIKIGVVDERSEIAACNRGIPQNDVGMRTDVLDGCPKSIGMEMLLRSMSPLAIVTDEIGVQGDKDAILKVLNSGVKIITTAHGYNISELKMREELLQIIKSGIFERFLVLSSAEGPGTLEEVCDGSMKVLYKRGN